MVMDWGDYSFVKRSQLRIDILKSLAERPKTPTELKKELGRSIALVSRYLQQLQERGLVECLTGKERMYKLFQTTEKGQKILEKM